MICGISRVYLNLGHTLFPRNLLEHWAPLRKCWQYRDKAVIASSNHPQADESIRSREKESPAMKHAVLGARLLLGLIFVVFGVNPWLQFLPLPELNEPATAFFSAMAASYLLTFVKLTEVVGGLLLLSGRFVPFALIILAPVVLNILFFHLFLDTTGLAMSVFLVAVQIFLAWAYRDSFTGVLAMNAQPKV